MSCESSLEDDFVEEPRARGLRAHDVCGGPERVDDGLGLVEVPGVGRAGQEVDVQRVRVHLAPAHVVGDVHAGAGEIEERQVDAFPRAEEHHFVEARRDQRARTARRPDRCPVGQLDRDRAVEGEGHDQREVRGLSALGDRRERQESGEKCARDDEAQGARAQPSRPPRRRPARGVRSRRRRAWSPSSPGLDARHCTKAYASIDDPVSGGPALMGLRSERTNPACHTPGSDPNLQSRRHLDRALGPVRGESLRTRRPPRHPRPATARSASSVVGRAPAAWSRFPQATIRRGRPRSSWRCTGTKAPRT